MRSKNHFVLARIVTALMVTVFGMTGFASGKHRGSHSHGLKAKNIIFFVGDGMGISTTTATRIFAEGVDGSLTVDAFPYTALSKTYTADHITPDSAGTMTAMMTGVNANSGIIGFGPETERNDFNRDGDGAPLWTVLELAKGAGKKVGVVTTARATHATPAACYAHVNERNDENDIALQALPGDSAYNRRLKGGIDLLMGGGRRYWVPSDMVDEEGDSGHRSDGRDLRNAFQDAGYTYIYNKNGFDTLSKRDMPVLGLFDSSHMEYEYDRVNDLAGEPSIVEMVEKSIQLLSNRKGYFLMVESGRIDHAHHAGNAFRSLTDTVAFDDAIKRATELVDLRETLIIVTADHSHVFNIGGYPLREYDDIAYDFGAEPPEGYQGMGHHGILDVVYDVNSGTGEVSASTDSYGVPYTTLLYANGPGYRGARGTLDSTDPRADSFPGLSGEGVSGPDEPDYLQEAAIPLGSETHSGEDVVIYAVGPRSWEFRGTVKNTRIFEVMTAAFGF